MLQPPARTIRRLLRVLILLALALAACGGDDDSPASSVPDPPTGTPLPFFTRIVTPEPTNTPLPTPTLAYDVVAVAGGWRLNMLFEIDNWEFADQLRYTGAADIQVEIDGRVTGSGTITPQIRDAECRAVVLDNDPLTFDVQGSTRAVGDTVWLDMTLLPHAPFQAENYRLTCSNLTAEVYEFSQAVFWPVLLALGPRDWGTATYEATAFSLPLTGGQLYEFEASIPQETGVLTTGYLSAEIRFNRN